MYYISLDRSDLMQNFAYTIAEHPSSMLNEIYLKGLKRMIAASRS